MNDSDREARIDELTEYRDDLKGALTDCFFLEEDFQGFPTAPAALRNAITYIRFWLENEKKRILRELDNL